MFSHRKHRKKIKTLMFKVVVSDLSELQSVNPNCIQITHKTRRCKFIAAVFFYCNCKPVIFIYDHVKGSL